MSSKVIIFSILSVILTIVIFPCYLTSLENNFDKTPASLNHSDTRKDLKANRLINLVLSEKELNLISLKDDLVKSLHYIEGEIEFQILDGDIYLKTKVTKPINFFINTELNRTYQILANTADIYASQHFIYPDNQERVVDDGSRSRISDVNKKLSSRLVERHVEKLNNHHCSNHANNQLAQEDGIRSYSYLTQYEREIVKIIKIAESQKKYVGYDMLSTSRKFLSWDYNERLRAEEVLIVNGNGLTAHKIIIYKVMLCCPIEIDITEIAKDYSDVIATSLTQNRLDKNDKAILYIIRKSEA